MVSLRTLFAAGAVALGAMFALAGSAQAQLQFPGGVPAPITPLAPQPILAYPTVQLNLRTGPSTQYPVILAMPAGSPLYVLYCGDVSQPWCYVNFNGYEGWASARYLTQNPPYVSPQPVYPQPVYPAPGYPQVYTPQQMYPGVPLQGGNFGLWFYVQ